MLFVVVAAASAAEPPSLETPVVSGARSKKDAGAVIGVEDFASVPDAVGAAADAEAFGAWLASTRGVEPERLTVASNPTAADARKALAAAAKAVKRGGMLWVYWSGHGAVVDGQRVLLGADAVPAAPGDAGIPLAEVISIAEESKAKQVFVLVDAGFGGIGRDGETLFPPPESVPPLPVRTDSRVTVWTSTTGAEPAFEYPAAHHGIFSYFVVGALRGWADGQIGAPADGVVSLQELEGYVTRVVRQVGGGDQKPGKETRPDIVAWPLASGKLESGPPKEDLAALALAEKSRRVKKAEGVLLTESDAAWKDVSAATTTDTPESRAALQAFIAKYDAATVTVDGTQVAVAVPQVAEARARLDQFARDEAKLAKRKRYKKRKSAKRPPPPAPPVPTEACMDLVPLEPKAITGELGPDLRQCLEERIAAEASLTTKNKLSRMLLIDADARGDIPEWTRLAARHLEDFDRSDPDLCFKFALVLSRGEIEDAELVLRWADYALENKHVWEGPTYVSRVYSLFRLKAETATRLWHDAEADFIEDRTEENGADAERYRGMAKDLSREWLDYARTSGQPFDRALVLCESASGNAAFCAAG